MVTNEDGVSAGPVIEEKCTQKSGTNPRVLTAKMDREVDEQ